MKTKEIVLSGDVGFDITLASLTDKMKDVTAGDKVVITLSTRGGDVFEGMAIYQYLKKRLNEGVDIEMNGMGIVASIGGIIFLSAKKENRFLYKGTGFGIHAPFNVAGGNAKELRESAEQLEKLQEFMAEIYVKETGLDKKAVEEMMAKETLLTCEEAVALGFASAIKKVEAVAKLNFKTINKMGNLRELLAKFGISLNAKMLLDANGVEIDFPDLDETAEPKVGDKALVDGKPANGEYVMPDGKTFVFVDGVLTEIKEPEPKEPPKKDNGQEPAVTEEVIKKLVEKVEDLTKENAKLKAELIAKASEYEAFKKAIKSHLNLNPEGFKDGGNGGRKLQILK